MYKYISIFALIFINACSIKGQYTKTASCQNPDFDKKVNSYLSYSAPVISVSEAAKNKDSYLFLDARELEEYNVSHIPSAKFIGYDDFNIKGLEGISKDKPLVVYCSIGYRSEKIATKLKKNGFTNVKNLYGSIFEWVNFGNEVWDNNNKPIKSIHTYNKSWSKWVTNSNYQKKW
jgi:rhodanese-related sulfurtransferase